MFVRPGTEFDCAKLGVSNLAGRRIDLFGPAGSAGERRSKAVYVDYSLGKSLGSFLGQIVSHAALDDPM